VSRLAHAHYLLGLGHLGKGIKAEAKAEFEQVLKLNPNHIGAQARLGEM
jgi:Tfp pilus assembly protein PilF